jgi:hypothetical protein
MFGLNVLVQLVGVVVAVYIAVTHSVKKGVTLVVIVGVLHFLISRLSNGLMLLHQKTMSEDELRRVAGFEIPGMSVVPPLWRTISTACGVLFFCAATFVIWLFVS